MNESEYILTHVLRCSRLDLYLGDWTQDENAQEDLSRFLWRRKQGEPVQYITGTSEFMGLDFRVDKRVLIPRPETEILVEEAIRWVRSSELVVRSILDMGTGAGNMVVSLAKNLPDAHFVATDISKEAVELARENAALNEIVGRIDFEVSDLFSNIAANKKFDMIISNPPYIPAGEIESLPTEVRYEPRLALDGGRDGLDFYRRIIKDSRRHLKEKGLLLMEMGYNQGKFIRDIFGGYADFKVTKTIPDYRGIERVIIVQKI